MNPQQLRRRLGVPLIAGLSVLIMLLLFWRTLLAPLPIVPKATALAAIPPARPAQRAPVTPHPWDLASSIEAAETYLNQHCDDSGRFEYRIDTTGRELTPRYNVLRHAGSVYGLGMAYARKPSPATRGTILKAAGYLQRVHLKPVAQSPGAKALFSAPGEEARDGRWQAKLGGAGLGILALLNAQALDPTAVDTADLDAVAAFIAYMQRPDGSFVSKYTDEQGQDPEWVSLYYPGEAILGLTRLYRVHGDPRWLRVAEDGMASLVLSRRGTQKKLPNDHWLMIAGAELAPVWGDLPSPPLPWSEVEAHLVDLGDTMIGEQERVALKLGRKGHFVSDERSSPTATRVEGLVGLYTLLPAGHPRRPALREAIEAGVSATLECQATDGVGKGGFLRARTQVPGEERSFNKRQTEVRIDYVQHALSALIGWESIQR